MNHAMLAHESSADWCRRMNYAPGTRLTGAEEWGDGPHFTTITITAIGRDTVLAVPDGPRGHEGAWTLRHRDWKPTTHRGQG